MKEYQLTLRHDKQKQYLQIAYLFILINLIIFSFLGFSIEGRSGIIYFAQAGALIVALGIDFFLQRIKNNEKRPYIYIAIFLAGMAWFKNENWLACAICIVVGFLFVGIYRELKVLITKNKIVYPSFPKKNISWSQLNNLVLKDGILTIDFKNNKLIQQYLENGKPSPDQKEFNEFCKEQLIAAKLI